MSARSAALVIIAVFVAASAALAAPRNADRWLPLSSGNRWSLEDAASGARRDVVCDAVSGAHRHVRGLLGAAGLWTSLRVSDRTTLFAQGPTGAWESLARFAATRAWELDVVLPGDTAPSRVQARWSATGWLELPAGTWPDCRRLELSLVKAASASSAGALDQAIWFAPDVGVARIEGPHGEVLDLVSADVGVDRYPSARVRTPAAAPDPGTALLLSVPDLEQATDYTCGPASLEAILVHYGVTGVPQIQITRDAKTDKQVGAEPENLAAVAQSHGLRTEWHVGLTLADLTQEVAAGNPVLVMIEAWRDDPSLAWTKDWIDGHYVVVIGIDARAVYVEDPSIMGARGVIPRAEFLDRWHCWDSNDKKAFHQGMLFRAAAGATAPAPTTAASGTLWRAVE